MKLFLHKSILAIVVVVLLHMLLSFFADGYTDSVYEKVSSGKKKSLALGGSRMSQAIIPQVIDSILEKPENELYNFAFTNSHSGIGPVYLNAVKNKVLSKSTNGIFLVSVSPWGLSSYGNDNGDATVLREQNFGLAKLSNFSSSPNYEYLLNGYGYGWGNILLKKVEPPIISTVNEMGLGLDGKWSYVHNDGSLEIKTTNNDFSQINKKIQKQADDFINETKEKNYELSALRFSYLNEMITFLKGHGTVYLVRLPVHPKVFQYEISKYPSFNQMIEKISDTNSVKYINFAEDGAQYEFCDGNHLSRKGAKLFSIEIAKSLNRKQ